MGSEQRVTQRVFHQLPITIAYEGREVVAASRDISLGGLFIVTDLAVPFEAHLRVRFTLPTQRDPIEVEGEVRWVERDAAGCPCGLGVRFSGMRAKETWALTRFLSSPPVPAPAVESRAT